MKVADIMNGEYSLALSFDSPPPQEEDFYLVVGELQCANGWTGPHFAVMGWYNGHWSGSPDGPIYDGPQGVTFPMWAGGSPGRGDGLEDCPFKPLKWALLPRGDED